MTVDPYNAPLLMENENHPARHFLMMHNAFCRQFLGFELAPASSHAPSDVAWMSLLDGRTCRLSDLLYAYLSFTPRLRNWIENPPSVTQQELVHLNQIGECRARLAELLQQRAHEIPSATAGLIRDAERVLEAWECSIVSRLAQHGSAFPMDNGSDGAS